MPDRPDFAEGTIVVAGCLLLFMMLLPVTAALSALILWHRHYHLVDILSGAMLDGLIVGGLLLLFFRRVWGDRA